MAKIIALSGSTVKSGVVEKAMEQVLKSTGQEWKLVRLKNLNMKYCTGCVGCAHTNRCVLKDDINEILGQIEDADAVLIGGLARFGKLNGLTKVFIERMFPLFHNNILKGKLVASVSGGLFDQETVKEELSAVFGAYKMDEVGALTMGGNASCYKCGKGETCNNSAFRAKFGDDAKITKDVFYVFDKDKEAVERATLLGKKIAEAIENKA
ncbi:flavodoxin family protein [Oceanirhabdus sp. W0125-5]|uniref:flavodoxin family protein n=1 Tax=Oceanirhabdus sp. W0125-5 TaxID=2999116 RepID=UPI0022F2B629|nr:flavodoxin family protein [Oceanirhabdus sp. W0125-5]WBW97263.1 flavodoxin family protein [Oceanirhabdus sp. W0125-5]